MQLDVGDWGLFCGPDGKQLVSVGGDPCGPVSARKVTKNTPRRLLLDESRVARALQSGDPSTELVSHRGSSWVVTLRPVITPRTGATVAVHAAVSSTDQELPDPPLVGSWEWEIERGPDGQPTPNRRSYWDRNLFRIYEVAPDVAERHRDHWETGEWANELIDQADQMRVNSSIRDGLQDGLKGDWGVVRCLTCNIVTGYGSSSPGLRHLRLVGQIVPIHPEDEQIIMQGFSYEVPSTFHDLALEQDAGRVDDVLRGVMELAGEPMAVVDAGTLDVLMTSPAWRNEDFGHVGGLGEIASEDSGVLHSLIAEVASGSRNQNSMRIDLNRGDGSAQNVLLTATGAQLGGRGRDVVVRLDL
ncbi:MAG: hypothetical protein L0H74_02700 [Brachybacterium sp.]|nr:hypothetical protein [Brachybacterium sp.]